MKFTKERKTIARKVNGQTQDILVFNLDSEIPGPHIYIQSSVHGAELQGNAVIYKIMSALKSLPFKGSFTIVPHANPLGGCLKMGDYTFGRIDPISGENYNRTYFDTIDKSERGDDSIRIGLSPFCDEHGEKPWSEIKKFFQEEIQNSINKKWEDVKIHGMHFPNKLCLTLQEMAARADYVFDLHTAPVATHYVYTPEYCKESALQLNFPNYIVIPNEFAGALDEATFCPWWSLKDELSKRGRDDIQIDFESYTIELCGEEVIELERAQVEASKILNFLHLKGVIDQGMEVKSPKQVYCKLENFKTYHAPMGGLVDYHKTPGEIVKKGEKLATILSFMGLERLEEIEKCEHPILAQEDLLLINHFASAAAPEGADLFQYFTNFDEI
ncbi:MAG: hypothetical protein HOE90_12585 [Bacteriovoracaceae bacterium]|jgi:uncharacterized protein|nr:hypothetical protein [Bacteriovoracaceae bacterium]